MWTGHIAQLAKRGARHGVIVGALLVANGIFGIIGLADTESSLGDSIVPILLGIGGVIMLVRFGPRLANVEETPEIKALASQGTPLVVAQRIQTEIETASSTLTINRVGSITITKSWLIRKRFLGLDLIALSDLVWAFKRTTQFYSQFFAWFTPGRRSYTIVLHSTISDIDFGCFDQQADEILAELAARAPNVLIGWSNDLDNLWRRDRPKAIRIAQDRAAATKAGSGHTGENTEV